MVWQKPDCQPNRLTRFHPKYGGTRYVLGPRIQFLTALSENDDDYCLIKGTVPAGVVVPLHSHAERETFYVVGGEIQGLQALGLSAFGGAQAAGRTVKH